METADERTTLARLLLLLHLVFGSAIHLRKAIVQQRAQQEQLSVAHSRLTERVLQVAVRLASRLSHATALAVVVNFASELMVGFVCKWKELYRSNDLLMNANVKVAGTRLVSIYGDRNTCTQDAANQLDDARHEGTVLLLVHPRSVAA